jgi:flagellar motor switch protein FliM
MATETAAEPKTDTGASNENTAKTQPWDFAAPSRIPQEQVDTIEMLLRSYAENAPGSLSTFLTTDVTLELENLEQVTFAEYLKSLSLPTCIALLEMQPLSGYAVMEVNSILLYGLVDKLLGGSGEPQEVRRPFTELELTVSRKFFSTALRELDQAWSSILSINFSVREFHTNPAAVRVIPTRETCLVATFKTEIGEASGLITLAIPYLSLEPITAKLGNAQFSNRYRKKQPEEIAAAHRKNLGSVEVQLDALLGTTSLPMVELLSIQEGDVLSLNHRVHDPIEVRVAGKTKFTATPGLIGRSKGILINEEM